VSATVVPLGVKPRRRRSLVPFTVPHFRVYASRLVYDDGETREPEDWQLDFAAEVFRSLGKQVRENWLIVPEGNGKTTFVAILGLYGADWAMRPWIPVGASSRDQALTLYTQAKGFVDDTPGMSKRFECMDGYRSIRPLDPETGKRRPGRGLEIKPWDPSTNDGVIPFPYYICDELHRHPDMSLWRLWKGKCRKRTASGIGISTAGAPGEDFEEARDRVRELCQRVRKSHGGTLYRGQGMSMWEYRLERPELATDPQAVAEVNPLSSNTALQFAEELSSPTLDMGDFKRLKCNIPARSTFAAITDEEWANMRLELEEIPPGVHVDCGLDLGWKQDTTALVSEWTNPGEFRLLDEAQVEVPPRDGTTLHPDKVKALIIERHERNPIDALVMDMSDGADIAAWAADELGLTVIDRPQGNDLHVIDYKHFMRDIRLRAPQWAEVEVKLGGGKVRKVRQQLLPLRRVRHCPLLTRHSMNAIGRRLPRGDTRFDRPTSSRGTPSKQDTRVIDGLTAAGMVNTHCNRPPQKGFDLAAFRIKSL
jgi:phage terminase large subunit-like protein